MRLDVDYCPDHRPNCDAERTHEWTPIGCPGCDWLREHFLDMLAFRQYRRIIAQPFPYDLTHSIGFG